MIHRHYVADLFGEGGEYRTNQGEAVGRTTFYTQYLKTLGISPLKDESHRAYVTHEQKELLDEYHRRRCESKQSLNEFLAELKATHSLPVFEPVQNNLERVQNSVETPIWLPFLEALTPRLVPPVDPLQPQEQLQKIVDRSWQVSTSQLQKVLGVKPRHQEERYGFRFEIVGKVGRESAWSVKRVGIPTAQP